MLRRGQPLCFIEIKTMCLICTNLIRTKISDKKDRVVCSVEAFSHYLIMYMYMTLRRGL